VRGSIACPVEALRAWRAATGILPLVLDFLEQADILNRDRGQVGKGLDERDLFIREGPHSLQVIDHHDAKQVVALQYGNSEHSSDRLGIFRPVGICRVGPDIRECGSFAASRQLQPDVFYSALIRLPWAATVLGISPIDSSDGDVGEREPLTERTLTAVRPTPPRAAS
jgi:hypothetical protein